MRRTAVVLLTIVAVLALVILGALAFIQSGTYNIAATDPHGAVVEWIGATIMEKSVKRRAESEPGAVPGDTASLALGMHEYEEMCAVCHGAPGAEPDNIGKGLNPAPPEFAEEAEELEQWSDRELFWIIKHGLKATGMPAFGPTHDDSSMWAIVAAVKRLPELTPEQYRSIHQSARHTHDGGRSDTMAADSARAAAGATHVHEDGSSHSH